MLSIVLQYVVNMSVMVLRLFRNGKEPKYAINAKGTMKWIHITIKG